MNFGAMPIRLIAHSFLNRLREPSSWGGIAVLLAVFGMSNTEAQAVTDLLAAGAAAASIFMGEGSN